MKVILTGKQSYIVFYNGQEETFEKNEEADITKEVFTKITEKGYFTVINNAENAAAFVEQKPAEDKILPVEKITVLKKSRVKKKNCTEE
jgi:hypothetical protein